MSLSDFEEWKKIIDFFRKGKKERPSINTVDEERIVWKNVNRLIGTRFNIDGNKPEVTIGPSFGSRGAADAEEWDEKKERVISVMEIKRSSNLKLMDGYLVQLATYLYLHKLEVGYVCMYDKDLLDELININNFDSRFHSFDKKSFFSNKNFEFNYEILERRKNKVMELVKVKIDMELFKNYYEHWLEWIADPSIESPSEM